MDEEIWLSEDEEGPENELECSTDPSRFNMSLTYQEGQSGGEAFDQEEMPSFRGREHSLRLNCEILGYHVRNKEGEIQRKAISSFHGGFRKKPAYTVSCEAKAMIHGRMSPDSDKAATLLVYEFKFLSRRGTRIKSADILFEFRARSRAPGAIGPSVVEVRPKGQSKMGETIENQASKFGLSFNVGPSIPGVEAGVTASGERITTKDVKYHTIVTGDNPADMEWGGHYEARFTLEENKSQESGIPTQLTAVILLEREDEEDFEMVPRIGATPDFGTKLISLGSSRAPDDPVQFRTQEPMCNRLDRRTQIDPDNLEATDLDSLWICNMYNLYMDEVHKLERED
ncbi:hypothetical protein Daus18300_001178 [Diaporthe australafricana]|uniref:Uncharacterized protein n=1 Tax=Diaporthe australafricana TaxID=127596 RepID=A0ABR3Y065_9PEZI